jgi:hypothetical protein
MDAIRVPGLKIFNFKQKKGAETVSHTVFSTFLVFLALRGASEKLCKDSAFLSNVKLK